MKYMRWAVALLIGLVGALSFVDRAQSESASPVVVELFTSQGCSSCPPADAYLQTLAKRPDILALGFHVDYWDYGGWADPFAKPEYGQRQRDYATAFKDNFVYTPLAVIQGSAPAVGSDQEAIDSLIRARKAATTTVPVILSGGPFGLKVDLPAIDNGVPFTADIWLVRFDGERQTPVLRGENRGRQATDANIVRELLRVAEWNGNGLHFEVVLPKQTVPGPWGCAILVQAPHGGPILGAAKMTWVN
ncbi:MAG: DUF1223 domain-containing protein [Alphaproteobacteria bacterium]